MTPMAAGLQGVLLVGMVVLVLLLSPWVRSMLITHSALMWMPMVVPPERMAMEEVAVPGIS